MAIPTGLLNRDDAPDLVVAGANIAVLHGNAAGTFAKGPVLELPRKAVDLAVADVNGDFLADLILASGQPAPEIGVWLAGSDEGFGPGFRFDTPAWVPPRT